jgi:hypothetical protein
MFARRVFASLRPLKLTGPGCEKPTGWGRWKAAIGNLTIRASAARFSAVGVFKPLSHCATAAGETPSADAISVFVSPWSSRACAMRSGRTALMLRSKAWLARQQA